jgi:hypothetical protein
VVPKLGEQAVKLREIFVQQLTVGPIFVILLAVTLKFLDALREGGPLKTISTGISGVSNATAGRQDTVQIFFSLLLMIVALHIMLKITKSMAGAAGTAATNFMGQVGGFAGGMALGGAGMLGRATLGNVAAKVRDSSWVRNNQDSFIGRRAYNLSNSVASSTFDLRNSKLAKGGFEKLGLSKGMGAGHGGGYDQDTDAKIKDRQARYGRIKTTNADGSVNAAGVEAKQRFFESQAGKRFYEVGEGGSRARLRETLTNEAMEEAEKENKKVDRYVGKSSDEREKMLKTEKDPTTKEMLEKLGQIADNTKVADYRQADGSAKQKAFHEADAVVQERMIAADRARAVAENNKIDLYDRSSGGTRQAVYSGAQSNPELQKILQGKDRAAAVVEQAARDKEDLHKFVEPINHSEDAEALFA